MLIKLCGLTRAADAQAANAAAPDFAGFVIDVPGRRRSIDADAVAALSRGLDEGIVRVGVFMDEPPERIASLVAARAIDAVQLHGREDEAYLANLRALLREPGAFTGSAAVVPDGAFDAGARPTRERWRGRIVRAFRVRGADDVRAARETSADAVLLDGGAGEGRAFDWECLRGFPRPFFLAGGLSPENVVRAVSRVRELAGAALIGVDMSSGVETEHVKDPVKMAAAVAKVRSIS